MTSYNLLNHVYTANNRELITDILRCEFGFQGCGRDTELIRAAVADGRISSETVRRCACRLLRLLPEEAVRM